jgi:hypothetical protein
VISNLYFFESNPDRNLLSFGLIAENVYVGCNVSASDFMLIPM